MKCLICGKDYIALGVHVKLTHKMDVADYKHEFGLMKTTPLIDDDLSKYLSKKRSDRIANDPEYRKAVTDSITRFVGVNVDNTMSKAGREKLATRNKDRGKKYLEEIAPAVAAVLKEKKTLFDVRRDLGCGRETVLKIVDMGMAEYNKDLAIEIRADRARKNHVRKTDK